MTARKSLPPLTRPLVTGTQGIFAQKRKGKSYTAQTQAEDWLDEQQQLAIIDPTGAWWGLRSSADGKQAGYPITIFGGEHADVPLELGAGSVIAEAMVRERFSAVLDLKLLDPEDWPVFAADFLGTLYKLNRSPMHLFIDEVDQFAPQTTEDKAQQRCRRIVNRVVRLGGICGIGCTVITQRTAVLDKSILAMCDTIVALQMNAARDLKSLREELSNHAERSVVDKVIGSLGDLPRGEAWVLTPNTKTFERMAVRAKRTFDSGRTPDAGEVLVPPKELAAVDVARLGAAIAATVEHAKANDPTALRARVAELETKLRVNGASQAVEVVERLVVTDEQLREVALLVDKWQHGLPEVIGAISELGRVLATVRKASAPIAAPASSPVGWAAPRPRGEWGPRRASPPTSQPKTPPAPALEKPPSINALGVLSAIATLKEVGVPLSVNSLAAWIGLHPRTKALLAEIGELRRTGMIDVAGLEPTAKGAAAVGLRPAPTREQQLEVLRRPLLESQARLLDVIHTFEELHRPPTHAAIAAWLGVHPRTKALLKDLGALRARGYLIDNELTTIGALASRSSFLAHSAADIAAPLDDQARKVVEVALREGEIKTMSKLAELLDVHPRTKAVLSSLGQLRARGLITNGWPLRPTSVFPGVA